MDNAHWPQHSLPHPPQPTGVQHNNKYSIEVVLKQYDIIGTLLLSAQRQRKDEESGSHSEFCCQG